MIAHQEVLMDRIYKARVSVKTALLSTKISTVGRNLELETLALGKVQSGTPATALRARTKPWQEASSQD
jgi:hypothetical protein